MPKKIVDEDKKEETIKHQNLIASFEASLEKIELNHKETIDRVCETFEESTKVILDANKEQSQATKELILLLKQNGKKKED
jgi:hypothetical protein